MKAITIWQPYASLVAIGAKSIETRGWATNYRGSILIHAAKLWNNDRALDCQRVIEFLRNRDFQPESEAANRISNLSWEETLGCGLAVARLVDCRPMEAGTNELESEFGFFGPDRFGWVLEDVQPLDTPFPIRGAQGLWQVVTDDFRSIQARLSNAA